MCEDKYMRRIVITLVILLAVFSFINAYAPV